MISLCDREFSDRLRITYDVCISLLLGDQSLDLRLRLLLDGCDAATECGCCSAGESSESCAEEASRVSCALLAVERGRQRFRARAL